MRDEDAVRAKLMVAIESLPPEAKTMFEGLLKASQGVQALEALRLKLEAAVRREVEYQCTNLLSTLLNKLQPTGETRGGSDGESAKGGRRPSGT